MERKKSKKAAIIYGLAAFTSMILIGAFADKSATEQASDLVAMYVQNEVNADNKMKGKKFYVEGKIGDIGKDILDNIYVTLESGDIVRTVQCYIDDKDLVARLQNGQRITVFGKCEGLMMNVLWKDREVVPNLADLEKQ